MAAADMLCSCVYVQLGGCMRLKTPPTENIWAAGTRTSPVMPIAFWTRQAHGHFLTDEDHSMLLWTQAAAILIAWPVLLGATALATYEIVTHREAISGALGFAFASTLTLSAVNIVASNLVYMVVAAANWHPRLRTNVRRTQQGVMECRCLWLYSTCKHHFVSRKLSIQTASQ